MSIYAEPLRILFELQGNALIADDVNITATPFTLTFSMTGSTAAVNVEADPLTLNMYLKGRARIEPTQQPPLYQIEIMDTDDVPKYVFGRNITNLRWDTLRLGGCNRASFEIVDPPVSMDETALHDYKVRILIDPGSGLDLWWQGYIERARLQIGDPDQMSIMASGLIYRLERISVVGLGFPEESGGVRFENMDAAAIARALIDRANTQGAGLTYTYATVPDSGFWIESQEFNSSTFTALKTLADLAGNAEFGVDRRGEFYFLPESGATDRTFIIGKDVLAADHSSDSGQMINRIYLMGAGDYRVVLEDTASFVSDQAQGDDDTSVNFGKSSTSQKLCQPFTTALKTLSAVDLKIGKTGWSSNLVTDGDMELTDGSAPPNWPKLYPGRTVRRKAGNPHGGGQCLEVRHAQVGLGRYGVYQDVTVTADQELQFSIWSKDPEREDPIQIELVDGSAYPYTNGNEVLFHWQGSTRSTLWYRTSTTIIPTGTTVGIRAWAVNRKGGTGTDSFYLDDVTLMPASDVLVSIVERLTAGPPATFDETNPLATATIAFEDIPDTPATIRASLVASPLDEDKTYGILVQSAGENSDSTYFLLRSQSTLSGLLVDNGQGFVASTGKAYFLTYLPSSQATYGVKSETIRHPHLNNDEDAALWGQAMFASRGAPIEQGVITLSPNRNLLIEESVPVNLVRVVSGRP